MSRRSVFVFSTYSDTTHTHMHTPHYYSSHVKPVHSPAWSNLLSHVWTLKVQLSRSCSCSARLSCRCLDFFSVHVFGLKKKNQIFNTFSLPLHRSRVFLKYSYKVSPPPSSPEDQIRKSTDWAFTCSVLFCAGTSGNTAGCKWVTEWWALMMHHQVYIIYLFGNGDSLLWVQKKSFNVILNVFEKVQQNGTGNTDPVF